MARGSLVRGRGGVRPPQRQIANFAFAGDFDGLVIAGGGANTKFSGSFGGAVTESAMTLVRTRGEFSFVVVGLGAAGLTSGVFGMIIVSADAFAAGVVSMPGPITDSQNDWFVYEPFTLHTTTAGFTSNPGFVRQRFDSRGMRKLKLGDTIAPVVEFEADVASTVDGIYMFRQQFKL